LREAVHTGFILVHLERESAPELGRSLRDAVPTALHQTKRKENDERKEGKRSVSGWGERKKGIGEGQILLKTSGMKKGKGRGKRMGRMDNQKCNLPVNERAGGAEYASVNMNSRSRPLVLLVLEGKNVPLFLFKSLAVQVQMPDPGK
jgi:hypothetical protein